MVYDAANLPTALGRSGSYVQYLYDPLNRKARQSTATDMTYYLGDGYERAGAPQYSGAHRHELGPLVVTVQSRSTGNNADVYYELRDRLGSAVAVVDDRNATTNAIEHREYDAFGAVREPGTLIPGLNYGVVTAHGFTDQEHVDAVKLIHMNGRVYDYGLGRFLSVDPIIQNKANSQSLNPYSYIGNNPLSGVDPSGYEMCTGSHIADRSDGASCQEQGVEGGSTVQSRQAELRAWGATITNKLVQHGNSAVDKTTTKGPASKALDGSVASIGSKSGTVGFIETMAGGTGTGSGAPHQSQLDYEGPPANLLDQANLYLDYDDQRSGTLTPDRFEHYEESQADAASTYLGADRIAKRESNWVIYQDSSTKRYAHTYGHSCGEGEEVCNPLNPTPTIAGFMYRGQGHNHFNGLTEFSGSDWSGITAGGTRNGSSPVLALGAQNGKMYFSTPAQAMKYAGGTPGRRAPPRTFPGVEVQGVELKLSFP